MEAPSDFEIGEIHWMLDMLQTIDVGLVVIDQRYRIRVWNGFMENHSGLSPEEVRGKSLFECFPEVQREWFERKTQAVFTLKSATFSTWEQRPYLFQFRSYRPVTGREPYMYQNVTIAPLASVTGVVDHICLLIYDVTAVATNQRQLAQANAQLSRLSRTDKLTQLHNRGFWEEQLERAFKRFQRSGTVTSLVMFDIDHFKRVNDNYGHQTGDEVIRMVAKVLRNNIRETDIAGRYGGEEFGVILHDTSAVNSRVFAERLREAVASQDVRAGSTRVQVTISLGICEVRPDMERHEQWIELSDQALYQSKQNGRNQTTVFE